MQYLTPTRHQLRTRHRILALEESLRTEVASGRCSESIHDGATPAGSDQADHHFAGGIYARGLWIPAGTLVVGKIHKQARICIVAAGRCKWRDEYGDGEVEAPWVGTFAPGSKTVVYAITDTYWVALTATELLDPIEILETLSAKTHAEMKQYLENTR